MLLSWMDIAIHDIFMRINARLIYKLGAMRNGRSLNTRCALRSVCKFSIILGLTQNSALENADYSKDVILRKSNIF